MKAIIGQLHLKVLIKILHLKVLIKAGGVKGFTAAGILAGESWQMVAKEERVADAALHAPVIAPLIISGRQAGLGQAGTP